MNRPDLYELTRLQRFCLLAALYFAQGLPFGLFMQALPVVLRAQGVSLEAIGFSAVLAAPWALKFLWAGAVDRAPFGLKWLPRRKGWIVPLQAMTAVLFLLFGIFEVYEHVSGLLVLVFVINLFNATQDIATDGLAVDILPVQERGMGNSLQVGGYRLGMIVGGAGMLVLIDTMGWHIGMLACAALLAAGLLPILLVREAACEAHAEEIADEVSPLALLTSFFERRWAWAAMGMAATMKFGDAFAGGMLRPLLIDNAFSMREIGTILGGVGFAAGLLGAGVGGILADRLSRTHAVWVAVWIQLVGVAAYLPLVFLTLSPGQVAVFVAIEHFNGGVATVVLFACMMDWARPAHSGADYTLMASVVVISSGVAQSLSGVSAASLGYANHFMLALLLTIVSSLVCVVLFGYVRRVEPLLNRYGGGIS